MNLQDAHVHRGIGSEGIGRFFCNASCPDDWQQTLAEAVAGSQVIPFIGVHPWKSAELPAGWCERLEAFCSEHPCCGIGEIGLDAVRAGLDFNVQEEVCARQIALAVRLRRPLVLHCVGAWRSLLELLRKEAAADAVFMLHAFSGPADALKESLALGAYVSFRALSGLSAEKEALVRSVPADRLLLESDYPYLAGRRPQEVTGADGAAHLLRVYRDAARIRGVGLEELSGQVWENGTVFTHAIAHR